MTTIIKTDAEYKNALQELRLLMDSPPVAGTSEADRLQLLALLIEQYESHKFPRRKLDPVAAIELRMEQQDLAPRDLVPFLGSRSRVSEVLARKRPLSLSMIRALHHGLGIPAESLLENSSSANFDQIEWNRFPIQELIKRRWLDPTEAARRPRHALQTFLEPLLHSQGLAVLYRKSCVRTNRELSNFALAAWSARVLQLAEAANIHAKPTEISTDLISQIAKLSVLENGPALAREFLAKHGVILIVESHLPRTHLDGAAMLTRTSQPVIGLTLRYDRIDSFWFTLAHEIAHLALHLDETCTQIFDDLDSSSDLQPTEKEADMVAGEGLIPTHEWKTSPARSLRSPEAAAHLATRLGIHPAIVAGRIRREYHSFRVLSSYVGQGQVRKLFPNVAWGNPRS